MRRRLTFYSVWQSNSSISSTSNSKQRDEKRMNERNNAISRMSNGTSTLTTAAFNKQTNHVNFNVDYGSYSINWLLLNRFVRVFFLFVPFDSALFHTVHTHRTYRFDQKSTLNSLTDIVDVLFHSRSVSFSMHSHSHVP